MRETCRVCGKGGAHQWLHIWTWAEADPVCQDGIDWFELETCVYA